MSIWQRAEIFTDVTSKVTVGLTAQSGIGLGPRVSVSLPLKATIWSAAPVRAGKVTNISSLTVVF